MADMDNVKTFPEINSIYRLINNILECFQILQNQIFIKNMLISHILVHTAHQV